MIPLKKGQWGTPSRVAICVALSISGRLDAGSGFAQLSWLLIPSTGFGRVNRAVILTDSG